MVEQAVRDGDRPERAGVVVLHAIRRGLDRSRLEKDRHPIGQELKPDAIEQLPVLAAQDAQQAFVGKVGAMVGELVLGQVTHGGLAELRAGHAKREAPGPRAVPIRVFLGGERERGVKGLGVDHGRSSSLRRTAARGKATLLGLV
ncbi:hypothetical protein D3C87_1124120 [compost metagenome]